MAKSLASLREQNLGRQLLKLERHFTTQALSIMQQQGINDINLGHFSVLPFVDDQGVRATAIALQSGISKQAVGKTLDDLKAKGYLNTLPDPIDKRANQVRLSDKGIIMMKQALLATQKVQQHWCEQVGVTNFDVFQRVSKQLLTKLDDE